MHCKLVITSPSTSDEWSLRPVSVCCVLLSYWGVIFVTGTADPGFHTLDLFGEDRKRTIKFFLHSFGLPQIIRSSLSRTFECDFNFD